MILFFLLFPPLSFLHSSSLLFSHCSLKGAKERVVGCEGRGGRKNSNCSKIWRKWEIWWGKAFVVALVMRWFFFAGEFPFWLVALSGVERDGVCVCVEAAPAVLLDCVKLQLSISSFIWQWRAISLIDTNYSLDFPQNAIQSSTLPSNALGCCMAKVLSGMLFWPCHRLNFRSLGWSWDTNQCIVHSSPKEKPKMNAF